LKIPPNILLFGGEQVFPVNEPWPQI